MTGIPKNYVMNSNRVTHTTVQCIYTIQNTCKHNKAKNTHGYINFRQTLRFVNNESFIIQYKIHVVQTLHISRYKIEMSYQKSIPQYCSDSNTIYCYTHTHTFTHAQVISNRHWKIKLCQIVRSMLHNVCSMLGKGIHKI